MSAKGKVATVHKYCIIEARPIGCEGKAVHISGLGTRRRWVV